jgi:hypothetical protein
MKSFIIFASGDIIQTIASGSNKKIGLFLTNNRLKKMWERLMNRTIKPRDLESTYQDVAILDVREECG